MLPQTCYGKCHLITMVEATNRWLEKYPLSHATAQNTNLYLGFLYKILKLVASKTSIFSVFKSDFRQIPQVHLGSFYLRHNYNLKHNCISVSLLHVFLSHRSNWPWLNKGAGLDACKKVLANLNHSVFTLVNQTCSSSSNKRTLLIRYSQPGKLFQWKKSILMLVSLVSNIRKTKI